jgi:isoleucyl-tRNA synthetase
MRKNKGFDIVDRIKLYYEKNDKFDAAIKDYIDMIKNEILAVELVEKDNNGEKLDLNGLEIKIDVEKIKK